MLHVVKIFTSPGHNFFGHHGEAAGNHPTESLDQVECVAGKGLRGDRFYDYKDNYKGQVTFFSKEVFDALCQHFDVWDRDVGVLRRNILIQGGDLNALIGAEFEVQGVRFKGTQEAAPCYWMNEAFALGAEEFLKGQGGLRAHILTDGILRRDRSTAPVTVGS